MKGYSQDLRERVIGSWQQGKTQAWIAATFEISVSSIKRYISQYRAVGHVEAKVQSYKQPTIRDEQLAALVKQLEEHPMRPWNNTRGGGLSKQASRSTAA